MKSILSPRLWLLIWGGLGVALLVYVIVAASVQPGEKKAASALHGDASLLIGEMEDFAYAFPPRNAPSGQFQAGEKNLSLADFRGKTILVNFWATTCTPCLKELPSLDALEAKLGGRKFEVVAVAADPRGPEAAAAFFERLNIEHLELYTDTRLAFSYAMGAEVLPLTVLYDQKGRELGRLFGEADWQSPEAIRLVQSAIE